ncbi:hypothetical protein OG530_01265 [Streptomyces decoyicus]
MATGYQALTLFTQHIEEQRNERRRSRQQQLDQRADQPPRSAVGPPV